MKRSIARTVASVLPKRAVRIANDPSDADGLLDRIVKAGLYHRAVAQNDLDHLAWYHRQYWQSEAAQHYFGDDSTADVRPLLIEEFGLGDQIANFVQSQPDVVQHIVELGCGNGRTLHRLLQLFPHAREYIGLDINSQQNDRNAKRYADTSLQFITAHANDWLPDGAQPNSLFMTSGGVLEYFSESAVATLLQDIATRHAPSVVAIIEPVDEHHDLESQPDSFVYGPERSFSHNYPRLFHDAAFDVLYRSEDRASGHRWIALLATTSN